MILERFRRWLSQKIHPWPESSGVNLIIHNGKDSCQANFYPVKVRAGDLLTIEAKVNGVSFACDEEDDDDGE